MPEISFRKEALERLTSPDQLDERVAQAPLRGWLTLFALSLLLGFALFWAVFAEIQVKIKAPGIFLLSGSPFVITAFANTELVEWKVHEGDAVRKGQLLAVLKDPELEEKLNLELAKKLAGRRLSIEESEDRIASLRAEIDLRTKLIADRDGIILQIQAYPPTYITIAETIAIVSPPGDSKKDIFGYAFVKPIDAASIMPGQRVEIQVSHVNAEQTGLLMGTVRTVSASSFSERAINSLIPISGLAKEISKTVALSPHIVTVDIIKDDKSPTGYHWSGFDPKMPLRPGNSFSASIVLKYIHPIDYLWPTFSRII